MATIKYYDGATWVTPTKTNFKYYNGSTWVEPSDVKVYNGSTWETVFPVVGPGIALRTSANNTVNTPTTSLGVTIPGSTQVGDLMILAVAVTNNNTTVFNAISGWTKQGEQRAGTAGHTMGIFTRLAQGGDASSTVTSTSTVSGNYTGHLRVYSGVHQTTPIDATTVFTQLDANATSASAPAITVATASAMLVTFYSLPTTANTTMNAADFTDPSGFSNEIVTCSTSTTNNAALATYNMLTPGTGSQGPFSITGTQARRWALATMALRPA